MIAGATDYQERLLHRWNHVFNIRKHACNMLKISGKKKVRKSWENIRRPHSQCCIFAMCERIEVEVQNMMFQRAKAMLSVDKSYAFKQRNRRHEEQR